MTNTPEFTDWELSKLTQHVACQALTYIQHYGMGGLRGSEIEEMERWKALSDKISLLKAAEQVSA